MSGDIGLPAPKALLKNFSVEDVDEVVKSSGFAQPFLICTSLKETILSEIAFYIPTGNSNNRITNSNPELPEGTRITSAKSHGVSFWTQTARLDTILPSGIETAYFLKVWR